MLYTDCIQDFEEKRKETIELSMIPDLREEHETGFEPATLALARRYSTTEPLVQNLLFCRCISDNTYDTGKRYICQQIFFIFQIFSLSFRISRLPTYILFGKSFSRILSSF